MLLLTSLRSQQNSSVWFPPNVSLKGLGKVLSWTRRRQSVSEAFQAAPTPVAGSPGGVRNPKANRAHVAQDQGPPAGLCLAGSPVALETVWSLLTSQSGAPPTPGGGSCPVGRVRLGGERVRFLCLPRRRNAARRRAGQKVLA